MRCAAAVCFVSFESIGFAAFRTACCTRARRSRCFRVIQVRHCRWRRPSGRVNTKSNVWPQPRVVRSPLSLSERFFQSEPDREPDEGSHEDSACCVRDDSKSDYDCDEGKERQQLQSDPLSPNSTSRLSPSKRRISRATLPHPSGLDRSRLRCRARGPRGACLRAAAARRAGTAHPAARRSRTAQR